ncbi:MAG: hypothetical protein WC796_00190 [Candidatus Pacearchaeota archaeon]|jgi:hypothetical protein
MADEYKDKDLKELKYVVRTEVTNGQLTQVIEHPLDCTGMPKCVGDIETYREFVKEQARLQEEGLRDSQSTLVELTLTIKIGYK